MLLHSSPGVDYVAAAADDLNETRARYIGQSLQLFLSVLALWLFAYNLYRAISLAMWMRHFPVRLLCIVQAAAGVALSITSISTDLPGGADCHAAKWAGGVGLTLSTLCTEIMLLLKAYIVHDRPRWLLVLLVPLTIIQFGILWVIVGHAGFMLTTAHGCTVAFPAYYPWMRFALNGTVNATLSIPFLMVAVNYYRRYGSDMWACLSRDGILYMVCAIASNLAAALFSSFAWLGGMSEWMYFLDCT
ncbi:hypothetical protein THASP1DRAFT_32662 [Thamnocephalis sphaerospora]|uniref:Uncharacterized protein n=1 Tax=Thamnocephalis sphaerospora TaxID=78915 RepID=A0A4P9XIH8_9FUNG|nr:hypothetical protein THASP1DRAFT_32662 [Thamnocephalis sphaerospora]|eukprot:RKP05504.1 hypothetical protein THASP1DRAFT_32662 [Thamnocephalis sphaerospora]